MSEQSHYEQLGVDENSSFDEIQDARNRLVDEYEGDRKQLESIEAAYDAILMERLRLRQEGKIKVPDRIRFPDRVPEPPPQLTPSPTPKTPDWLQSFLDTPNRPDILWPAGLFLAMGVLSLSSAPVALALGVGFCLYFLNRKERKFGRSFLLTLVGLVVGIFIGLQLGAILMPQLQAIGLDPNALAAMVTFFLLWLISSFLR